MTSVFLQEGMHLRFPATPETDARFRFCVVWCLSVLMGGKPVYAHKWWDDISLEIQTDLCAHPGIVAFMQGAWPYFYEQVQQRFSPTQVDLVSNVALPYGTAQLTIALGDEPLIPGAAIIVEWVEGD
ncbi:MAG: hypothetical protein JWL63_1641 [Rhodocyclales bacterium]|nr:hypothetical protein [Rhodocyclales bacterium]